MRKFGRGIQNESMSMTAKTKIPIIKLFNVLIVSIQTTLSDRIALELKDDVGREIERTGARGLAIDVSGVDLLDSYNSRVLRDMGLMARLMGVETVVCGIHPMIAMTLTEMDMSLEGIATELNLERALGRLGLVMSPQSLLSDDEDGIDLDE